MEGKGWDAVLATFAPQVGRTLASSVNMWMGTISECSLLITKPSLIKFGTTKTVLLLLETKGMGEKETRLLSQWCNFMSSSPLHVLG